MNYDVWERLHLLSHLSRLPQIIISKIQIIFISNSF